ncbi:carboxypeptidase M32 [Pelagibius litoralis]|uniref:Metal-dependent carboxypeptidase n=1 Tax=Pelagibius litoralis TaxID=374515 RepID=A0A967F340_9PROT|nr:carboxypeptidase M32 [Pelagibius litoralis]NIA72200.1 carboxypeptidase M32 [Pelagibius litoralis]
MTAYDQLSRKFKRLHALQEAAGILSWDMSTVMPSGGAEARTEQLATLDVVCHETLTDPAMDELFDRASAEATGLSDWAQANLTEMRRRWLHATALESDLVEALSKACKRCEMIWREARPKSDFAAVLPAMTEVLNLTRQAAAAKSEKLGCSLYDALLDEYEPGGSSARIDTVFADLADFLPGFLDDVLARQGQQTATLPLAGPFPRAQQEALGRRLMAAVGFDFDHGRLDVSLHPFCGGVPDDVRITTRYDEDDFMTALMGVLHETGHAMYERGLPQDWRLQPVGEARGMAMHESQSLMVEMQACRSAEFVSFLAPLAREAFGGSGPAWEADNLLRHYNAVKPDFIRVDADEVTYPAHVILRYRLEKALIAGEMELEALPDEWNRGIKGLLGIAPPEDRLGCLQDIHWYDGAWGYFPTYTLGAMTAAQLFAAAKRARPEIPAALGRGDFAPLMGWLREHVHAQASSAGFETILERASGEALNPEIFKAHLKARYLS